MSCSSVSDADLLEQIRKAKFKVISDLAAGKSPRRIAMGDGMMVENHDPQKLLAQLGAMEREYEVRVEGRQGGRLTP